MFPLNLKEMPTTASSLFSAYASFTAFAMLLRSMGTELMNLVPDPVRAYIESILLRLFTPLSASNDLTLVVDEYAGLTRNQVYDAAEIYLQTKISPSNERLRVSKTPRQKSLTLAIEKGQQVIDTFDGITDLKWCYVCTEPQNDSRIHDQKRYFELTFHKRHKDRVVNSYLPYVLSRANSIQEDAKVVKLYSLGYLGHDDDGSDWGSINLEHPATFDTIAMDLDLKQRIKEDMDRFVRRREFYKKVGKAWKRGYLLYGPPGTGKSSLIAAMANYLKFDVYDLELSSVYNDSNLRRILLSTTNRSILVIEDIDCSQNRESEEQQSSQSNVTLSGLLNFVDGLWSSCGDERIIVFTTNKRDQLDPALLRPGRMDMHIHLSYCTVTGFRVLVSNYLGIGEENQHRLCGEIEGLIENVEATPAEVAEELMKSDDADVALQELVNFLKNKNKEAKMEKKEGNVDDGTRDSLHCDQTLGSGE